MTRLSVVAVLALLLSIFFTGPVLADTDLVASTPVRGPEYTPAGQLMVLHFTVFNSGPDIARDVKLNFDIPLGVDVEILYGVDCDRNARPLQCAAGDIGIGESRTFELRTRGPLVTAMHTLAATVSSATPDRDPSNDRVSVTFDYRVDAGLVVQMHLSSARVDPGEAFRFPVAVHNIFETLPPQDIRFEYEALGATIEKIDAPSSVSCTLNGERATCTAPSLDPNCRCLRDMYVTVRTKNDRAGGVVDVRATVSSNLPDRFPETATKIGKLEAYRWLAVTTTADAGPGSLRAAIDEANATCGERACKIVFEIPPPVPAEGWFTIIPAEPLPPITTMRMFIDGSRQALVTGDTNPKGPEIAIDGRLAHRGLEIHSKCEAFVRGLALGNFDENQALWFSGNGQCPNPIGFDWRVVTQNHIGVDPTGTDAWPNLRGIRADDGVGFIYENVISRNTHSGIWMWRGTMSVSYNRIENNGSSGIFFGPQATGSIHGNVITNNREMGIAAARGSRDTFVASNSMRDNGGLGIDWALDGVSRIDESDAARETNAPLLLSARYDAGRTHVSLQWKTTPLRNQFGDSFSIELFANSSAEGEGETALVTHRVLPENTDGRPFELAIDGDQRGKWITATGTREWRFYFFAKSSTETNSTSMDVASTSEMSNGVQVE